MLTTKNKPLFSVWKQNKFLTKIINNSLAHTKKTIIFVTICNIMNFKYFLSKGKHEEVRKLIGELIGVDFIQMKD